MKHNLQIDEDAPIARELGSLIVGVLERHPLFLSAALPARIYPPLFNRYDGATGMHFGSHVDGAMRLLPGTGVKMRTDLAATLFLAAPESYDGGELLIDDAFGAQSVKLPAGHMVLYPATSRHRVMPVTRGSRLASFFWVQSLVRDDAQRALLFDLDMAIVRLSPRRSRAFRPGRSDRRAITTWCGCGEIPERWRRRAQRPSSGTPAATQRASLRGRSGCRSICGLA